MKRSKISTSNSAQGGEFVGITQMNKIVTPDVNSKNSFLHLDVKVDHSQIQELNEIGSIIDVDSVELTSAIRDFIHPDEYPMQAAEQISKLRQLAGIMNKIKAKRPKFNADDKEKALRIVVRLHFAYFESIKDLAKEFNMPINKTKFVVNEFNEYFLEDGQIDCTSHRYYERISENYHGMDIRVAKVLADYYNVVYKPADGEYNSVLEYIDIKLNPFRPYAYFYLFAAALKINARFTPCTEETRKAQVETLHYLVGELIERHKSVFDNQYPSKAEQDVLLDRAWFTLLNATSGLYFM